MPVYKLAFYNKDQLFLHLKTYNPYKKKHTLVLWCTLLGIYPKELKIYIHKNTCIQMFTAAMFITAKTWEQSRCPLVGERMNKLWFIQTMELYSGLKRSELLSHEKTWTDLTCICLSERSQSEKATYGVIQTKWDCGEGQTMESVNRSTVARECGRGMNRQRTGNTGQWKHCMIACWWISVITLSSKLIEHTTAGVNPNTN